jgi:alkylated DNA repair dioxygenase AlkB
MSDQLSMFGPDEAAAPSGLRYEPDFLTLQQESELIARIAALPLAPFQFGQYEGKRRVVYFGSSYDFTHQRLEKADELPEWLSPYAGRAESVAGLPPGSIRHALVTEYDLGAGIGWHRDKKEFDVVLGVSLAAPCKFRFRRKGGGSWLRYTLDCAPRSLYVMDGEARTIWEHSIPAVAERRYSITFRTMAEPRSPRPR